MKDFFEIPRPTFSFEIFPPKGPTGLDSIFATVDALVSLAPDLMSVTYGAGGTSRENTAEIASAIQNRYNVPALAHLTCVGNSREQMEKTLADLHDRGIKNILAMRGDRSDEYQLTDFQHASELIKFIKDRYDFKIFAACYPEKHIEAPSMDEDIRHLKEKVDCGVDVLVSQLFFKNDMFYKFLDRARGAGVNVPIEAGIMPVTSASQIKRMVTLCGASIPDDLRRMIDAFSHNSMAMKEAGATYATAQIVDLLANGVDGIHLYSMNLPDIAKRIAEGIRGILYSLRVKRD